MSLLMDRVASLPPPRLDGREVLVGPDPSAAKVKGVMFGGRKQFLIDTIGEQEFDAFIETLTARTRAYVRTPLASSWCEFESLVELDRAIHDAFAPKYGNVLALIGAASAELGIGRIYRSLDSTELLEFLRNGARLHDQYQKFGTVRFEEAPDGARMIHSDYPCYSPIFCASAIGYFLEAILRHGGNAPAVTENVCQTRGDSTCTYDLRWQ